jgi:hypothetical protein
MNMFNYSWKLGRLGGIAARLPRLLPIVLAAVTVTSFAAGDPLSSTVSGILFLVAILAYFLRDRFLVGRRKAEAVSSETAPPIRPATDKAIAALVLLSARARADEVARALLVRQAYFPVVQGDLIVGIVSRASLLNALANGEGDRSLSELMVAADRAAPRLDYESAGAASLN